MTLYVVFELAANHSEPYIISIHRSHETARKRIDEILKNKPSHVVAHYIEKHELEP